MTIAITGATGTVGSEVISQLKKQKRQVKGLVRDLNKGRALGVPCTLFDYSKPETFDSALQDVDSLLIIANKGGDEVTNFAKKAKEKGISKVIVISGLSANVRGDSHLAMTEKAVRKGGLVATHLRLNWFMQNFITFFKPDIDRGLLELPAEDAKVSFIDVRDIAHCVVKLFEEPLNQERAISLTGPEALTHGDVVEIIGRASGRKIEYRSISEKAAREKFKKMGWGEESIEETIQLFEEMRAGACALITNEVEKIMGRLPTRFSKFASDYANHWRRTSLEGVRE